MRNRISCSVGRGFTIPLFHHSTIPPSTVPFHRSIPFQRIQTPCQLVLELFFCYFNTGKGQYFSQHRCKLLCKHLVHPYSKLFLTSSASVQPQQTQNAEQWHFYFQIPSHFYTRTEEAITTGLLTKGVRIEIIQSIAAAMMVHTNNPISIQYNSVCQKLI